MRQARAGHDTCGQRVTPRCRWAAGPGRTTSRRAERSSRRGRLTGGSPPTGTHSDQAPQVWRAPEGPEGLAAVPVGGGGAWTAPHSTEGATGVEGAGGTRGPGCGARGRWRGLDGTTQHRRRHRRGGRRRDRRAWLRCPWAVAGPGRASRRRAEPKARGADGSRAGHRPRAHQAARPNNTPRGARNASGATKNTAQGRGPTGPRP